MAFDFYVPSVRFASSVSIFHVIHIDHMPKTSDQKLTAPENLDTNLLYSSHPSLFDFSILLQAIKKLAEYSIVPAFSRLPLTVR